MTSTGVLAQETPSPQAMFRSERSKFRARRNLFCIAIALSIVVQVGLPLNLAPIDAVLAALLLLGIGDLIAGRAGSFAPVFRRIVPAIWLLALATAGSLAEVGLAGWALDHGLRDLLAPLVFPILGACLWSRRDRIVRPAQTVFACAGLLVAVSVILTSSGAIRKAGLFQNPNYAGHFLATACVVVYFADFRFRTKALVCLSLLAGLLPTGSFGSLSVLAGVGLVIVSRHGARLKRTLAWTWRAIVVASAVLLIVLGANTFAEGEHDLGSGASSGRFERSRDTRLTIWGDALELPLSHPMGVAPRGYQTRDELPNEHGGEIHNDYLAFFVEQGPLGFVALAWILRVVWRAMPARGSARALAVGLALSGVFREVVNFRHLWLALVLLTLADMQRSRDPQTAEVSTRKRTNTTATAAQNRADTPRC